MEPSFEAADVTQWRFNPRRRTGRLSLADHVALNPVRMYAADRIAKWPLLAAYLSRIVPAQQGSTVKCTSNEDIPSLNT